MQDQSPTRSILNIACSVMIPVYVLNHFSVKLGPLLTLIIAISFPLAFGLYELIVHKQKNFIALLGLLNVLVTGGLALFNLKGGWFAVKEAAFPFLIGCFVLGSSFGESPFVKTLLLNPNLLDVNKLQNALLQKNKELEFSQLLKKVNIILAGSFFISSLLNFILAMQIFKPIEDNLNPEVQGKLLNEQIAQMTWSGMLVIALPSFVMLIGLFYYFTKEIKRLTSLDLDSLIQNNVPNKEENPISTDP